MSSDECKDRIVEHLQEYYTGVPAAALNYKNWKRETKYKNDSGRWERVFTNKQIPGSRVVVGDDDDELFIVSVVGCGEPASDEAGYDAEDWNEMNSYSNKMSDYYFAIYDDSNIFITPKWFWDEEGYLSSDHFPIEDRLNDAGIYSREESVFGWNSTWSPDMVRAALLNMGMIENSNLLSVEDEPSDYYDENGRWVGEAGLAMNAPVSNTPYLHAPSTAHSLQVFMNSTNGLTQSPAKPKTDATGEAPRAMDFDD